MRRKYKQNAKDMYTVYMASRSIVRIRPQKYTAFDTYSNIVKLAQAEKKKNQTDSFIQLMDEYSPAAIVF